MGNKKSRGISRRNFIVGTGAASLFLFMGGLPLLTTACSSKGSTIKIGITTPSTGVAAEKGKVLEHGNRDALKYVNEVLGGAGGYELELVWMDNGYNAATMVSNVNKFMDDGCVMFGCSSSPMMTAGMTVANQNGFPGLAAYGAPIIYRPPQHIYGQMPDYGDDWQAFSRYYMENIWKGSGKPKMALLLLNNATGKGAKDAATALAENMGIEIVAAEEHAASTISEMESLTRVKSYNPDVIFISSTPGPTAVIMKNLHDMDMYPSITVGCAHASFTKALIDLAGADIVEDVYGVFPTMNWYDDIPGIVKAKEYCQKNNPADSGNMDYLSTWSTMLVVAAILREAIENAGYEVLAKGDVESWRAVEKSGIQKLDGYDVEGITAPVSYTEGDNRLDKSLKLYRITGGEIVSLTDWIEVPPINYEEYSWWA
jgi:branched-chain amino acid transport system substrate-binding protein